jgi:type IV pilus assembly protein PilE
MVRPLHSCRFLPDAHRGFTLIELMVVVAIVAVLAAVAMPAYFDTVRKSRRADAISQLSAIAQRQENWRSNNPLYTTNLGSLGINASTTHYSYAVTVANASSAVAYTATATRTGSQTSDTKCGNLSLAASAGQFTYGSTGTLPSARCWER